MADRDTNTKTNIAVLMHEMKEEIFNSLLFSPWTGKGKVDYEFTNNQTAPSKKVVMSSGMVTMIEDWSSLMPNRWADSIEYPQRKRLTGDGFYGDSWIEKTGEDLEYRWTKCFINLMSKTVMEKRGDMDQLRDEDFYDLLQGSYDELVVWWAVRLNAQAISSIYEGGSLNLTAPIPNSPNGIGMKKILPSVAVYYNSNTSAVTEIGTTGKNKLTTAFDGISGLTYLTAISTTALIKMAAWFKRKLFMPTIPFKNRKLYGMIISDDELTTLLLEQTFRETYEKIDYGNKISASMLAPDMYVYRDWCLIVDNLASRKWHTTYGFAGENGYHNEPTTDLTEHNIAVVLGEDALVYAVDKRYNMATNHETFNHKSIKELAMKHVFGWMRKDYVEETDMTNYFVKGQTTAAYLTSAYDVYNKSLGLIIWKK